MRILIVSQYFWPETFIINDLVRHLAANGHQVTVLTGKPNYPGGSIFPGYTAANVQSEEFLDWVEVLRVPLRPRGRGGGKDLVLNYLSFVWSGLRYSPRLAAGRKFDAVVVFAPSPITSAIPAILLKYSKKAHLAIWVQDLWPESLAATGFVRHRLVLRLVGWMVRAIYRCTDTLLIQSRAFYPLVARYADEAKIVYYPNSVDSATMGGGSFEQLPHDLAVLLETRFCVVFAGNVGKAQSVETILDAAVRLKDLPDCRLVLVGSGSMLEWVRERKAGLRLDNLVLTGRFPMDMMPHIFRRAAVLLVTLKNEEIFSYTIPSKVQAYLAAGKPIIAALNGEGARVVAEAGAGLTCAAEDGPALARCVRKLYEMPEHEKARMGEAGKIYFSEHFDMARQARRLVEILESRIAGVRGKA